MSDQTDRTVYNKMQGSAHNTSEPTFEGLAASGESDVEGNMLRCEPSNDAAASPASARVAASEDGIPEVEGHAARSGPDDRLAYDPADRLAYEVEGHALRCEPSDDAAASPASAARLDPSDDAAREVEGHYARMEPSDDAAAGPAAAATEGDIPEVEGHIHPILMQDYTNAQSAEYDAAAARAQRTNEARSGRDGGIIDKVLRRKNK